MTDRIARSDECVEVKSVRHLMCGDESIQGIALSLMVRRKEVGDRMCMCLNC